MTPAPRARDVVRRLEAMADPKRAASLRWFFKTGPGQYGEGDLFIGLTMPQARQLVTEYAALPLEEVERLLDSTWHEARTLAVVIMANRYRTASPSERAAIYRLYLRRSDRINNWDLVDISAPHVVGAHLERRSRAPLRRLAKSTLLWDRRIAMVSTMWFIRNGEFEDTFDIARMLLDDREDLIHKAMGWMLREVGKKDERALLGFLDRHAGELPRTALRYSLERLSPALRRHYMDVPRVAPGGRPRRNGRETQRTQRTQRTRLRG